MKKLVKFSVLWQLFCGGVLLCKQLSMTGQIYNSLHFIHVKIDYASNKLFVEFLKKKSDAMEDMMELLKKIKQEKKRLPKYIRMDRSGGT